VSRTPVQITRSAPGAIDQLCEVIGKNARSICPRR